MYQQESLVQSVAMYVDYEWGIGAYIAIAWIIFILFGLIGIYAHKIKEYYDKKS